MKLPKLKRCTKCNVYKLRQAFHIGVRYRDGLTGWCKVCHGLYSREKKYLNHAYRLLWSSCANARTHGVEHTLVEDDIILPVTCAYLGCMLDYEPVIGRKNRKWNAPSIDRIDPSKGYVPGNVQIISFLANKMKQDATPEQLIAFANGILRIYGNGED